MSLLFDSRKCQPCKIDRIKSVHAPLLEIFQETLFYNKPITVKTAEPIGPKYFCGNSLNPALKMKNNPIKKVELKKFFKYDFLR